MEGSSNVGWKIFMAFSLYRNVKEIFKMKQCNKVQRFKLLKLKVYSFRKVK